LMLPLDPEDFVAKVKFCKTIFDFKSNDKAMTDKGRDTKR
jgi:hypothetical protein